MTAHIRRIVTVGHQDHFFRKFVSVPAAKIDGIALPSAHNIIMIISVKAFHITCVKIVDSAVLHKGRAGINSMGIKIMVRK